MMKTFLILVFIILFFIIIWFFLHFDRPLILVALGEVNVYKTEGEALGLGEAKPVAKILIKQSVDVIKCVDVKHYLIYKVSFKDGRIGYVNEGEYVLKRDDELSYC